MATDYVHLFKVMKHPKLSRLRSTSTHVRLQRSEYTGTLRLVPAVRQPMACKLNCNAVVPTSDYAMTLVRTQVIKLPTWFQSISTCKGLGLTAREGAPNITCRYLIHWFQSYQTALRQAILMLLMNLLLARCNMQDWCCLSWITTHNIRIKISWKVTQVQMVWAVQWHACCPSIVVAFIPVQVMRSEVVEELGKRLAEVDHPPGEVSNDYVQRCVICINLTSGSFMFCTSLMNTTQMTLGKQHTHKATTINDRKW